MSYFLETTSNLTNSLKGLSDEQFNFKQSVEHWSINECIQHLVLVEKLLAKKFRSIMQQPSNAEQRMEIKITDSDFVKKVEDRSNKVKAIEQYLPIGLYKNSEEAMLHFVTQRNELKKYILQYSEQDMRNHVIFGPFGTLDAYQYALLSTAHIARHTKQIEEVKADKNYPSSSI
ncbi:MAG TPA: DinB family protein [Niabella sp.]|nr:DinB family protein [Niabella sp.]HQX41418.1 DinB family protein [Niabella sp.]HRB62834.1 DinB family protein [Niabella sp.]HRB76104.1 DinB family protein [Niabella sp.]HRB79186.1 DinB family protein [Niabella sp.]